MGMYMYKVTGKKVLLSDGRYAHVAKAAYKPFFYSYSDDSEKKNTKMYYKTGCYYADKRAKEGHMTGLVTVGTDAGDAVFEWSEGSFHEGMLNNEDRMVKGVTVAGKKREFTWFDVKVEHEGKTFYEQMLGRNADEACSEVKKYLSRELMDGVDWTGVEFTAQPMGA